MSEGGPSIVCACGHGQDGRHTVRVVDGLRIVCCPGCPPRTLWGVALKHVRRTPDAPRRWTRGGVDVPMKDPVDPIAVVRAGPVTTAFTSLTFRGAPLQYDPDPWGEGWARASESCETDP